MDQRSPKKRYKSGEIAQGLMGALGIVIMKTAGQTGVAFGDTGILPEEDIFIFYGAPETFDADVVYTTPLTVH